MINNIDEDNILLKEYIRIYKNVEKLKEYIIKYLFRDLKGDKYKHLLRLEEMWQTISNARLILLNMQVDTLVSSGYKLTSLN